ncbi:LPXTG cell wall anchor domain-containing protein [Variovorax sp. PBS-H4]|uniref:LPXTG cell wall anchor domain-containing protein n=1 Tax=Variovorax sp. PBS-H4 TaxID=434008 RepID=UPI0013A542FD|nr:LPXTG cell wall anchor domain-containing protein [Variovorax sp. PBS-H4]
MVLAAGGVVGWTLPAKAAPALTAPPQTAPGETVEVLGTDCLGIDAAITATVSTASGQETITQVQPDPETGAWGVVFDAGSTDMTVNASCSTYNATTDYPAATIDVRQDTTINATDLGLSFPGYTGAVTAGGTLQIEATGFPAGENVTVTMYSTPIVLATPLADAQGRVVTTVIIPPDTAAGIHTIEVKGESTGLKNSRPILVQASSAGPMTTTNRTSALAERTPQLAATGTAAQILIPGAGGLLLAGGAALAFTRRRSTGLPDPGRGHK